MNSSMSIERYTEDRFVVVDPPGARQQDLGGDVRVVRWRLLLHHGQVEISARQFAVATQREPL